MIELKNITFYYELGKILFEDFNLKIEDSVLITGKVGSGKTTLLKLIKKILKPVEGEIYAPKIASVWQYPTLIKQLTVRENLELAGNVETLKNTVLYGFVADLFELKPLSLSGGQRILVELSRAYLLDTKWIILDEPTSNLDTATKKQLLDLLSNLDNKKFIIVTHEPEKFSNFIKKTFKIS